MCGSPSVDNSVQVQQQEEAARARTEEEARQARIREGQQRLATIFDGGTLNTFRAPNQDEIAAAYASQFPAQAAGGAAPAQPDVNAQIAALQSQIGNGSDRRDAVLMQQIADLRAGAASGGAAAPAALARPSFAEFSSSFAADPANRVAVPGQTTAGFGDDFYGGFRKSITDFYQPQLQDQYADAREQLTYALSRAGLLRSSVAGEKAADLDRAFSTQGALIESDADNQVNRLRQQVSDTRSALNSQLLATGDADLVTNEALTRMNSLFQTAPQLSALPALFNGVAQGIGGYFSGQQAGQFSRDIRGAGTPKIATGSAAKVVR